MPQTLSAIGAVAPRPGSFAALGAPAPTRVTHVYVATGASVHRGDSLVAFDLAPFDAAAQSAETALAGAEHAYERASRLSAAGVIPRKEVDQAATDLAQARAAATAARIARERATLISPIDGVVTKMTAVLGAPADAAQPVVEVADPSRLDVAFTVSPADAARIVVGAPVTLTAGATSNGEQLGAGTVRDVGAAVDSSTRGVAVRVEVGHRARTLRIGETVFGAVSTGVHPHAITVPAEALVPEGEGYRVFVVDSAGVAHARDVRVGARGDSVVEIVAGLKAGERVVTIGAYGVQDSAHVTSPER